MKKSYLLATSMLSLVAAGGGAFGQTVAASQSADNSTVETVIVTATKHAEKEFDVPDAISAVSGQQLEALRMQDARDAIQLVPTAFMAEINAGTARDINIRGVGTEQLFGEPGVALYNDDVFVNDFISYPTQFYDISRIEVLRGPQGALYGRDAVGGTVNVLSNMPTDEFEGSIRADYMSFNREELVGVINTPLTDTMAARFAVWQTNQTKGNYYNAYLHDYMDKNDSFGGRATFKAQLASNLTLTLLAEGSWGNGPGTDLFFPGDETQKTILRDTEPRNHFDATRFVGHLDWQTSAGEFVLIAGHRGYNLTGIEDTDLSADFGPTSNNGFAGQEITYRKNAVHGNYAEARWLSPEYGPVSILAGITYLDSGANGDVLTDANYLTGTYSGLGLGPAQLYIDNIQGVKSWAPYAEVTWHITDTLSLIGDARYTSDKKTENFDYAPTPLLTTLEPFYAPTAKLSTSKTFTDFSPGGTLAWSPDPDWRVYAKVQTGFRAGGYNFNVGSVADLPYNEERSINYEVGVKNQFADGHGYWALDGYMLDQTNILAYQYNFAAPPPIAGYLVNGGKARTYGVEPEIGYTDLLPGLDVTANLGWLDPRYTSGSQAFYGSLVNKKIQYASPLTGAFTAAYRHAITGDYDFLFNGSYTHRNAHWEDAANTVKFNDVDMVNLRAGVEFERKYDLSIFVQNALDNRYDIAYGGYRSPPAYLFYAPGGGSGVSLAPGRMFGVELAAKF